MPICQLSEDLHQAHNLDPSSKSSYRDNRAGRRRNQRQIVYHSTSVAIHLRIYVRFLEEFHCLACRQNAIRFSQLRTSSYIQWHAATRFGLWIHFPNPFSASTHEVGLSSAELVSPTAHNEWPLHECTSAAIYDFASDKLRPTSASGASCDRYRQWQRLPSHGSNAMGRAK